MMMLKRILWLTSSTFFLLISNISAQDCFSTLQAISLAELQLQFDDLRTPRQYKLCPGVTYQPGNLNEANTGFVGDWPLFLRSRSVVQCGDSGSSDEGCIIDGKGLAGILIDPVSTSQETERRNIQVKGVTFQDFTKQTELQQVVFFVAALGKITFDDCIFDNVGTSAPFFFGQLYYGGSQRALEAETDTGLDCDITESECQTEMFIKVKKHMESIAHLQEHNNGTRELLNTPNVIESSDHVDASRNEHLRGLQTVGGVVDIDDGFESGNMNIFFTNCLFKDIIMAEDPLTDAAHTILYFTGIVYKTVNGQPANQDRPVPGEMNVRLLDNSFENIRGSLATGSSFPNRRSIVEFQSNRTLTMKNNCFTNITIPSYDVEGLILVQAFSKFNDQQGNSVSNIMFREGPIPDPTKGCPFITIYNLDLVAEQSYGFLKCFDETAYNLLDECGGEPAPTPAVGGGGFVSICFSSHNLAELANGEMKRFDQLQLGDEVLTQQGFESIYSFGHYNPKEQAEFVQLLPSRLELSSTHLVFLQDGRAVPADVVKVGDILMSGEMVTGKRYVTRQGLYAPFTASGTIIANGQVASSFVSLQGTPDLLVNGYSTGISHQWMAHAFEVPHRLWCWMMTTTGFMGGNGGCLKESYTSEGISHWVSRPLQFFTWFVNAPVLIQVLLAGPILGSFGFLSALDFMMTTLTDSNQAVVWMCVFLGAIVYVKRYQIRKVKCE